VVLRPRASKRRDELHRAPHAPLRHRGVIGRGDELAGAVRDCDRLVQVALSEEDLLHRPRARRHHQRIIRSFGHVDRAVRRNPRQRVVAVDALSRPRHNASYADLFVMPMWGVVAAPGAVTALARSA
jgi:hypothetical protein